MSAKQPAAKSGTGVVFTRDGLVFEGEVVLDRGVVHFSGRRRVRDLTGITYRPADPRTWPINALREIRWLEQGES